MKLKTESGKKYISEVKKNLKCSAKKSAEFLDTLTPEIYNFELEHPNAVYDDYIKRFNKPKVTAEEYMKELSDNEKRAYMIPRIGTVIGVVLVVFVLLLALFIAQIHADSGYTDVSSVYEVSLSDISSHYYNDISK